jgi:hypothetical protein
MVTQRKIPCYDHRLSLVSCLRAVVTLTNMYYMCPFRASRCWCGSSRSMRQLHPEREMQKATAYGKCRGLVNAARLGHKDRQRACSRLWHLQQWCAIPFLTSETCSQAQRSLWDTRNTLQPCILSVYLCISCSWYIQHVGMWSACESAAKTASLLPLNRKPLVQNHMGAPLQVRMHTIHVPSAYIFDRNMHICGLVSSFDTWGSAHPCLRHEVTGQATYPKAMRALTDVSPRKGSAFATC